MTIRTEETRTLAVKLMEWHGGMSSPLYSVASTMFAGHANLITRAMIDSAKLELWNNDTEETDQLAIDLENWYNSCF